MDLIERQAAIDALGEAPKFKIGLLKKYAEGRNDQWFDDVAALVKLPSAQPERKTGRWLPDTRTFEMMFVCSECKASLHVDTINLKPSWDYCPKCGASMGGDTE